VNIHALTRAAAGVMQTILKFMSLRSRIKAALPSLIYGAFSLLPLALKARVLDKVALHVGLDYKNDIQLCVDSYWSYYRRISCAKEPDTIRWLELNLKPGDVFYDIGANIGAYSLVAASLVKDGVIVSIEPSFSTFKTLCSNLIKNSEKYNDIKFYPFGCAVGNIDGFIEFKFSEIASGAAQHGGSQYEATLNVPAITLDNFTVLFNLPAPTIMKIDVDGPEVQVLEGSKSILSNLLLRTVLIEVEECTENEVKRILTESNFKQTGVTRKGKWANIVFSRVT
jgi:FkbM family methyltransferase